MCECGCGCVCEGGGVNASGFLHSSMEHVAKQMFDDKFVYVNTVCLVSVVSVSVIMKCTRLGHACKRAL